jgi:hypothetical protein
VAENALAGVAWCRADVDAVIADTNAGLALARRCRLGQLEPALLVCEAGGLALRGDTVTVERLLTQARALGDQPMETIAAHPGRATCAYALDDLAAAARHLDAAAELAQADTTTVGGSPTERGGLSSWLRKRADAQPQLHRHRAHPAGPHPRG